MSHSVWKVSDALSNILLSFLFVAIAVVAIQSSDNGIEYPLLTFGEPIDVEFTIRDLTNPQQKLDLQTETPTLPNLKNTFPNAKLYLAIDTRKTLEVINELARQFGSSWKPINGIFRRWRLERKLKSARTLQCPKSKELLCYKNVFGVTWNGASVDKRKWVHIGSRVNMIPLQSIDFTTVSVSDLQPSRTYTMTIRNVTVPKSDLILKYMNSKYHYFRFVLVTRSWFRTYIAGFATQKYVPSPPLAVQGKAADDNQENVLRVKDDKLHLNLKIRVEDVKSDVIPFINREFYVDKNGAIGPQWIVTFRVDKISVRLQVEWIHNGQTSMFIVSGWTRNEKSGHMKYILIPLYQSKDFFKSFAYNTPKVYASSESDREGSSKSLLITLKWLKLHSFYFRNI